MMRTMFLFSFISLQLKYVFVVYIPVIVITCFFLPLWCILGLSDCLISLQHIAGHGICSI
jgi:hypothetical protein